ncbi:hypothetical protein SAMN05421548_1081 [Paraburkholderia lycopersici]|uniref:Uncharacterized protein n=1 Tax=Paraburkholderia lycopersici TaxID=416944 RepID=A0A1G6MKP4_9BURK|nr:hypothetical protein SAMN05421548_1081 [Paraburkholderia lycopersici]
MKLATFKGCSARHQRRHTNHAQWLLQPVTAGERYTARGIACIARPLPTCSNTSKCFISAVVVIHRLASCRQPKSCKTGLQLSGQTIRPHNPGPLEGEKTRERHAFCHCSGPIVDFSDARCIAPASVSSWQSPAGCPGTFVCESANRAPARAKMTVEQRVIAEAGEAEREVSGDSPGSRLCPSPSALYAPLKRPLKEGHLDIGSAPC